MSGTSTARAERKRDACALPLYDGEYSIQWGGFHNRPRGTASGIRQLLELVARVLPDSYEKWFSTVMPS